MINIINYINMTSISAILLIIGTIGIILLKKPLDKIIMLSLVDAGLFLAVVTAQYLDVALIIAILSPLSIIIFLLSFIKINQIRKTKIEGGEHV